MPESVSASKQDYLETILDFTADAGQVRSIDIARALKEQGLVEHEHYGDVKLTERGLRVARQVRARHNALKSFLVDVLGVAPETAENDACRMEHAISRETAAKLEEYLKTVVHPKTPSA
jgi:Mn-dependent DtxR family transcriptional regulator